MQVSAAAPYLDLYLPEALGLAGILAHAHVHIFFRYALPWKPNNKMSKLPGNQNTRTSGPQQDHITIATYCRISTPISWVKESIPHRNTEVPVC